MAPDFWAAMTAYVVAAMGAQLPGGFGALRARAGCVLPRGHYERQGAQLTRNTAGETLRDGTFAATFRAAGQVAADALADQFEAVIKDAPLVFAGGTLVFVRSDEVDAAALDDDPGPGLEDVYAATITVRYRLIKAI